MDICSVYSQADIQRLLKNKHVAIFGDSVQRGIYKDLVVALQEPRLLYDSELKAKGEETHMGDTLVFRTEMTNAKEFCEIREYNSEDGYHLIQFYFLTRIYNERMEAFIEEFRKEMPDVIIMNSALWDITRYGPDSEADYKRNISKLLKRMHQVLPKSTIFLWCTTMPLASHIGSGFLVDEVSFMGPKLRLFVLEANYFTAQLMIHYGFDVLDLHFYMGPLIAAHREKDGVHWDGVANRHVTNLILTFLHDAWRIPLSADAMRNLFWEMSLNSTGELDKHLHKGVPLYLNKSRGQYEAFLKREKNRIVEFRQEIGVSSSGSSPEEIDLTSDGDESPSATTSTSSGFTPGGGQKRRFDSGPQYVGGNQYGFNPPLPPSDPQPLPPPPPMEISPLSAQNRMNQFNR